MNIRRTEEIPVREVSDIVTVRQQTRQWAGEVGLSLVDLTKIVTAASELARNVVVYGGGGSVRLELLENGVKKGLRLVVQPVERAERDPQWDEEHQRNGDQSQGQPGTQCHRAG